MTEFDVSDLISVAEAIALIDSAPVVQRVVEVPLEKSLGAVLAEDILADQDYPPFDKSLMDGFAISPAGDGTDFDVVGEVAAGQWPARGVARGEAMAIMTGAPVPKGADGVVPVEYVDKSPGRIHINKPISAGQHIAARGHDAHKDQQLLRRGQRLLAAQLAVAAAVGRNNLKVARMPRVGVLGTGNELISTDATLAQGQIRNSNSPMLLALLRLMHCEAIDLGVAPDKPTVIAKRIRDAFDQVNVLLIAGGMSMGEYDYVPTILRELGVSLLITKLRIKPGKPFIFGQYNSPPQQQVAVDTERRYVFGLPGNPVSALVCTVCLAARLIRRMQGLPAEPQWIHGTLAAELPANGPREFYQPVQLENGKVIPLHWRGSADIFTLARARGLLCRPENAPPAPAGQPVAVMALDAF